MLTAHAILDVWERGRSATPARRALLVLGAAGIEDAASHTLARRDRALLREHVECFGPDLEAVVACPDCGEALEFGVPAVALADAADHERCGDDAWASVQGAVAATLRPLTAADVAEASELGELEAAQATMLERAVAGVSRDGCPVALWALDEAEREQLGAAAERFQPEPLELGLTCVACGHAWGAPLDVMAFLWAEIDASARRLLSEVDVLARTYGWSERDILALGERRRLTYLRLIAGEGP